MRNGIQQRISRQAAYWIETPVSLLLGVEVVEVFSQFAPF